MRLLDSEVNIDASKALLFTRHRAYFLLVVVTALMDAVSTMVFMHRISPDIEINLVVRTLSSYYGIVTGPLLGKVYQLFAVWVISAFTPRLTRFVCTVVICLNCLAFVVNMVVSN